MEQKSKKFVCIIGAGAAGCICAYFLLQNGIEDITLFDFGSPLRTLLPTGGGRCNYAHSEYDFRELAKNYPRGEKFLYSVFSRFSTSDTIEMFEDFGIESYTQDDGRIFPTSNSAKEVREKILAKIKNANFVKETVGKIIQLESGYKVKTEKSEYFFSDIVIATGGGSKSKAISGLNLNIVPFAPSLVGLNADIKTLSGVVLKNVKSLDFGITGDILFTHFGVSGPLIYKISALKAYENFPYKLKFDLYPQKISLQELLNQNPHKELKNILSKFFPHRFCEHILGELGEVKAHKIDGKLRDDILDKIHNFELLISGTNKGEETVTAGGYDLDEIDAKTMESKKYPRLYIIGEALNIDGFCGGFNLQNAWSTAYVAASSISAD